MLFFIASFFGTLLALLTLFVYFLMQRQTATTAPFVLIFYAFSAAALSLYLSPWFCLLIVLLYWLAEIQEDNIS